MYICIYNLIHKKNNNNICIYNLNVCAPLFCDELPKGNHNSSKGGAGGVKPLASAKSTHKA